MRKGDLRERGTGFMVKVVPIVIGCFESGMKQLEEDIRDLFNQKERFKTVNEMQKVLLRESESIL